MTSQHISIRAFFGLALAPIRRWVLLPSYAFLAISINGDC
jgi:hypothetical protein